MEAAFDAYFRAADLDRDGRISDQEAVAFFEGSGLPQPVLAQIWTYADRNRSGFLGREDFFNSLKLVTVAQSGRELTPDIVKSALFSPDAAKIPAPRINVSTAAPQTNSVASLPNATQAPGPVQQNPAPRPVEQNPAPGPVQQNPAIRGTQGLPGALPNPQVRPPQPPNANTVPPPHGQGVASLPPMRSGLTGPNHTSSTTSNLATDWFSGKRSASPLGATSQAPTRGISPQANLSSTGISAQNSTPLPGYNSHTPGATTPVNANSTNLNVMSSQPSVNDSKALVPLGNGLSSNSTFGADPFSATPSDLNTHLPPRKRLLAGLRTAVATTSDAAAEPLPSLPASAGDLAARLHEMALAANASSSSPEEMIEAARVAAQAAADAAVAARTVATEKAAVAAKARAAARAAMEFLDSFSYKGAGASKNGGGLQFKVKSRKKHVQVKMLYRPNGTLGPGEAPKPRRRKQSDEEVARNLHRVMNSSPRISHTGPPKRPRTITAGDNKDGVVAPGRVNGEGSTDACNGSSIHVPIEVGTGLPNECSEGKSSERTVPLLNHKGHGGDGEDSSRHAAKSSGDIADNNGVGVGNLSAGQKVKIKRKELLLNQDSGKETEPKETEQPRETEPFVHSIALDESKSDGKGRSKPNVNGAENLAGPADTKAQGDGVTPMKITSVWKFKKLKTSHCSSDSKVLHKVCSPSPTAAETSASVKAD